MAAGVLFACGTTLAWSLVPFFIRYVLGTLDPVTLAAFRLLLGGVCFLPFTMRTGTGVWEPVRDAALRRWIMVGAAALALNHILFSAGLQWTTPAAGMIAVQVQTIMASLFSWMLLGERISGRKGCGMVVVLAGIMLVNWNGQTLATLLSSTRFWGNLAMFTGGVIWGVYAVSQRQLSHNRDGRAVLAPIFLLAGLFSLPAAAILGELRQPLTVTATAGLIGLTLLGTVGGYLCLEQALARLPVATALTITNLVPLSVAAISFFGFGERVSLLTLIGGLVAVSGCIWVVQDRFMVLTQATTKTSASAVAGRGE